MSESNSKVFFTKDISVDGLVDVYTRINRDMIGKIGIKLHSGEPNGPNLLPIELIKGLQSHIPDSTIVECNVLYNSPRHTTDGHRETLKLNGFDFCPVDIMDADGRTVIPIPGMLEFFRKWFASPSEERPFTPGRHLTEVDVGKNLLNYESLLVYSHFKGHLMAGFGGALKNIGIGCASAYAGKLQIHDTDRTVGPLFLERMVESGKGIVAHFDPHITYINVLKNISVDCDCDSQAECPVCRDIGIVGSTDILAVEKASVDLVYALPENERYNIIERIKSRNGLHQLEYMKVLNMGNDRYDLIVL